MLYLGIDQHARQITISLRDENGDVLQARQVSTEPEKINAYFQRLTRERLRNGEPFVKPTNAIGCCVRRSDPRLNEETAALGKPLHAITGRPNISQEHSPAHITAPIA